MNENIKVFLRIKPNVENLCKLNEEECTTYKINKNKLFLYEKKKNYNEKNELNTKSFFFNHIFDAQVKQNEIFEFVGKNLIDFFLSGYNSSILAYGNTNSGKTYTLYGDRTKLKEKENNGLIYFCLDYFFNTKRLNKNHHVCISVIEIYLEQIRDLGKIFQLSKSSIHNAELFNFHESVIREDPSGNTYVEDITLIPVKSIEDVSNVIDLCFKFRKTNATKKNIVSSRSHCLMSVYQFQNAEEKEFISQINFIDLAGSEKFTDIELINKNELININNTLSVLNRVIMAINTKNKIKQTIDKNQKTGDKKNNLKNDEIANVHIPFRDSKLTRLLKNSLEGNSFTYIFICLNLHSYKIEDFINSLIFAKRCKQIKKKVKKNIIKNVSDGSKNSSSNSSMDYSSYESSYSSSSNSFLRNERSSTISFTFNKELYYKRKNKMKNVTHQSDILLNKLLNTFSNIVRKKIHTYIKQKKTISNNILKVIKTEEYNNRELEIGKTHIVDLYKQKKKELKRNEEKLKNIIPKNQQRNCLLTNSYTALMKKDNNNLTTSTEHQEIQRDFKQRDQNQRITVEKFIEEEVSFNEREKERNIKMTIEKQNEEIQNINATIDILLQTEIKKINEKLQMINEINNINITLFKNAKMLSTILRNIYQNKYNTIIKNGVKMLNISKYSYDQIKKSYELELHKQTIHNSNSKDDASLSIENTNILTTFQNINIKETIYTLKKS